MTPAAARRAFAGELPPAFLVKGLRMTSSNPLCKVEWPPQGAALRPQDGQVALLATSVASEPLDAVSGPPVPPPAASSSAVGSTALEEALAPGVGAALHIQMRALAYARGVPVPNHQPLALMPPGGPMLLKGIATRTEIDETGAMLLPNALHWADLPPLRLKHGDPCGEILSLEYRNLGSELIIECRADAEASKYPAFSVAFTPEAWELVDHGGRNFYFAVSKARLDECSLTDIPALRSALVAARCPAGPPIDNPVYKQVALQLARMKLTLAA